MKSSMIRLIRNNRGLLLFILLMVVFRSSVADWNSVPTGSMLPTIVEGDRVLVYKLAYDLRIPFTHVSLVKIADPRRGEIIVFDSKVAKKRLIKRVVGIPGDIVEMKKNVLFINGEKLNYRMSRVNASSKDLMENLQGVEHLVRIESGGYQSSFYPVKVPEDYFLVLGDNRDNSADSRVIGLVPREEVIGRSDKVVLSLNYDNYYLPRKQRFFLDL